MRAASPLQRPIADMFSGEFPTAVLAVSVEGDMYHHPRLPGDDC